MPLNGVNPVPKSAYRELIPDFEPPMTFDDSLEGDISLLSQHHNINEDTDNNDSSFDELLDSPSTSRKSSIFKEPTPLNPRGYEFRLKGSDALVYLTYPLNTIEIDTYGKIEYDLETKEKSMVVIIPNSKGLSVNNQKLADAYAIRTGCVTALLDIYFENPLNTEALQNAENDNPKTDSFISKFRSLTVEVALNLKVNYWLQSHSVFGTFIEEENRFQSTSNWINVENAITELLTNHEVENAIIVGFSFGANTAARVAIESTDKRVKSVVLVHPISLPKNALEVIKKSTLLIVGRPDHFYNQDDLDKFENDLQTFKNSADFKYTQLKLKHETPHGFAIAGDYSPMMIGDLPTQTVNKVVSWVLGKI